jgi:hypothetical protein
MFGCLLVKAAIDHQVQSWLPFDLALWLHFGGIENNVRSWEQSSELQPTWSFKNGCSIWKWKFVYILQVKDKQSRLKRLWSYLREVWSAEFPYLWADLSARRGFPSENVIFRYRIPYKEIYSKDFFRYRIPYKEIYSKEIYLKYILDIHCRCVLKWTMTLLNTQDSKLLTGLLLLKYNYHFDPSYVLRNK